MDRHTNTYSLPWLHELQQWLITSMDIYVQVQCFNSFNWGARVYQLNYNPDKGAPIIHEDESAEHATYKDALIAGLKEAFEWIEQSN
ncbi:hypothetical protein PP178_04265 [Zeaxanthinibacter sp. PT1]|uniref:hypothetical protein n=1 Tax=Zeaxanthinibacter TaxID=561554 RepID=UPI00234AA121|nr:hypothetical protein [Zeaxanthinibacter sp. PT1]MDC6350754.1 hypothetical protein [Zeaxanthinibacter sp. PT1]